MTKIFKSFKNNLSRTDTKLWVIILVTSVFSLVLLASASRNSGYSYFRTQLFAILIGYVGAYVITKSDYRVLAKHWKLVAGVCIALMLFTFFFGAAVKGEHGVNARAWIKLPGGINFQPSELAKIGFMITFAKHLFYLKENEKIKSFLQVALLGVHALVPMALTTLQGDDGAAIIFFFMFIFMAFAAGVQLRYILAIFAAVLILLPMAWQFYFKEYQKARILAAYNLEADPHGFGHQQLQGKFSIGSGKLFGQGLFNGPRVDTKPAPIVPVQESDLIFSVVGEELGFLGSVFVILLLALLLIRTLQIAKLSCDGLGSYICFGFFGLVFSQTMFNLGMCLSLLPVIGVTLPFFSAGGSSSACLYFGIGLIQNVFVQRFDNNKANFDIYSKYRY